MARQLLHSLFALAVLSSVQAYFLVGNRDVLVTERLDPILSPGAVSSHTHSILGGSNFGMNVTTALLRESECTTMPIQEDHSNYWFPTLYFQHKNGSFSDVGVGNVIYYLYNDAESGQPNTVQAFPDDFRMISGDMTLRSYNASSYAQQAITFLCLDFSGTSTRYNSLPPVSCPSGVRAQINFPMCWDGVNLDSPDHKSHVAFPSGGPDSGTCDDPAYPVTLPRIFIEAYLDTVTWDAYRDTDALNSTQPYVYSYGDPYGYGYHADFYNGWQSGVLQNVLNECACTSAGFGDATCCGDLGVFTLDTSGSCNLTPIVDEQVTGTLAQLPGNNPVQYGPEDATIYPATSVPAILSPAYAYTGSSATATGTIVTSASSVSGGSAAAATTTAAAASVSSTGAVSASDSSSPSDSVSATATTAAPVSASSTDAASASDSDSNSSSGSNSAASATAATASASSTDAASDSSSSSGSDSAASATAATASASSADAGSDSSSPSDSDSGTTSATIPAPPAYASPTDAASASDSESSSSSDSDSATTATPTGNEAVAVASSVSSVSDAASPTDASSATVVSSIDVASATVISSSAASSTAVSSSDSASNSSSSSSGGDDDDEYEYYCEKRPKKKSRSSFASKARRHHNAHRRLTSDDF